MEFFDNTIQSKAIIKEKLIYEDINQIVNVKWEYINEKNILYKEFEFKMKIFYPDTMNRLLIENGFIVNNFWGSYQCEDFNESSEKQIYKCSL